MSVMALTILEGSTFCICDERGDITEKTGGFFAEDTRFLSLFRLTVNGETPLLLSSGKVEHFSAAFYLRNPLADGLAAGLGRDRARALRLGRDAGPDHGRERDPAAGLVRARRRGGERLRGHLRRQGARLRARRPDATPSRCPTPVEPRLDGDAARPRRPRRRRRAHAGRLLAGRRGRRRHRSATGSSSAPRERWELDDRRPSASTNGRRAARRSTLGEQLCEALLAAAGRRRWDALEHSFERSVADLAALRMRGGSAGMARLPAAGMPWFMTVFGRDTLITSYQTLLLGPELARGALEVLAELQATEDDPSIDAEPGKIVHEVRHGKAAKTWFRALLRHGRRDAALPRPALGGLALDGRRRARATPARAGAARARLDRRASRRDGSSRTSGGPSAGSRTSRGRTRATRSASPTGGIARPPIAPVEVQGYVYDAKRRTAELAREVWGDAGLAERLEREAAELQRRFDEAYWTRRALRARARRRRRAGRLALLEHRPPALERDRPRRARRRGRRRADGRRRSGRAGACGRCPPRDAAYNPLSYHNGTVWPHDNSLIAAGLARYGRWEEARRIVRRDARGVGVSSTTSCRRCSPACRARETPFPIAYPTAARPQAWAAGTPVLLLQVLLGLRPDGGGSCARCTVAPAELPAGQGALRLSGVRAFGRAWDVRLEDGARVERRSERDRLGSR